MDSTKSIIKAFNSDKEVEYYSELIGNGLLETEKFVIKKYFAGKGKVLDLGCGAGREAFALAKKGFSVTGVDIAPKMIENAKKYAEKNKILNAQFLTGDITLLNLDESFDYVMLPTQTIEHIKGKKNRIRVLKKCRELLKENGVLFFTVHERKNGLRFWLHWTKKEISAFVKKPREELGDAWIESNNPETKTEKMFLHFYTKKEAVSDLREAGLKLIETIKSTEFKEKEWAGKALKYTFVCKHNEMK